MKLTNQVCTLEQAKRLKGLGVIQESIWYRVEISTKYGNVIHLATKTDNAYIVYATLNGQVMPHYDESVIKCSYSAFTVAELGVMLPEYTESHKSSADTFYCALLQCDDLKDWFSIEVTEAKARAAYLIYLLENGHTTAEEVNQRLQ